MQQIRLMRMDRFPIEVEDKSKYVYRHDRPLKLIQKLCIWFLERNKCYSNSMDEVVKSYNIDAKSIIENILNQEIQIFDLDMTPSKVYMGYNDFMELKSCEDFPCQYVSIPANVNVHRGVEKEIMGMHLIIVPWMSGVLVAP